LHREGPLAADCSDRGRRYGSHSRPLKSGQQLENTAGG
jgi:hypothetical protein